MISFFSQLSDVLDSVVDTVGEAAGSVLEAVSEYAGDAYDAVSECAGVTYDAVSECAGDAYEAVKENPGKAALGAVIGVGAVAAAPFTGGGSVLGGASLLASLTGAVGVATAAGVAGGVATAKMSEQGKEKTRSEGHKDGYNEAMAKTKIQVEQLKSKIKNVLEQTNDFFNALSAMYAVGISVAACDGEISDNEKEHIKQFVSGRVSEKVPECLKKRVDEIYLNPPNIKEAFEMARRSGVDMNIFDDVISIMIMIDDPEQEKKLAYARAWQQLQIQSA